MSWRADPWLTRISTGPPSEILLTLGSAAVVTARTGDTLREGVRNGTATAETRVISGVTGEQYGTRQSNISTGTSAGGSAIYGCRRPTKECTRHVNLDNGPAAAFATKGTIPFTLSDTATGLIPRLNADRVDNLNASEIVALALTGKSAAAGKADTATKADSATTADTATAVTGRTPLSKMTFVSSSASNADEATARAAATEVSLLKFGPFEIYGKCFTDTDAGTGATPSVLAELFIRTTESGATLDGGGSGYLDGDTAYLDTGTAETTRRIEDISSGDNPVNIDFDEESGVVMRPDATLHEFRHVIAVKETTPAGGDGPYGAGQRCGFAASLNT
ncbi:hypothetical protein [Paraconexibacter sp.]|uniref:hypothetical protein n=1 Tax=Paraconexibacter sp. TaxID=2949640 RepID=UPI003563CC37